MHTSYGNVNNSTTTTASTTTTTSTAPKSGKLDLENLRWKVKNATANLSIQLSQHDMQDLNHIRQHLDQMKETRAQVEDINFKPKPSSSIYENIDDSYSPSTRAAAGINNPPNKPPIAAPRAIKGHLTLSGLGYEYWMCACCDMVNNPKSTDCKKCKMAQGALSVSYASCGFCSLLVYISEEREVNFAHVCPMCKGTLDSII